MRAHRHKIWIFSALPALLGGCAQGEDAYPSLALRPFERGELLPAPLPTPAPAPIRPITDAASLADLMATITAADTAFQRREPEAGRLVRAAAGQSWESGARSAAVVALADLDAERAKTATALAAIDALVAQAATALAPEPELVEAQGQAAALLARQDAGIARLWQVMGS
ncbi:hypothetical protein [Erythrobacter donghaensis]|uniref:hypothetical protein n=1 Tax=Erythrobacter donghaensis TaxID=267135 RepID=UPI000A39186F|nr:hypothetical protein [Erythrobacter donghaensis]